MDDNAYLFSYIFGGGNANIEGVIKSLDLHLTSEDIRYLEEPYVPHNLSGVMAVNKLCYRGQLLFFENIFGVIIYKL